MKQTFEIPGRLMGLNEWNNICKGSYGKQRSAAKKREIEDDIIWCIKAGHVKPAKRKVFIHITWIEPNMKRDPDNIRFAAKFILDAMQKAGVIENDNQKHIDGIEDIFRLNRENPRIVVEIEEV